MKPKLIILDACVVIYAKGKKIWNILVNNYEIHLPSIVFNKEALYYVDDDGRKVTIDLKQEAKDGKIKVITSEVSDFEKLKSISTPNLLNRIEDGEKEALALLVSGKCDDFFFCTGDKTPIRLMSILGLGTKGISLERLLMNASFKKPIEHQYSKSAFDSELAIGWEEKSIYFPEKKRKSV